MCRFALLLALAACAGTTNDDSDSDSVAVDPCEGITPAVTDLTPEDLLAMLDDKDFELINVHVPDAGEIDGTDTHISFRDVDDIETYLNDDKGAKVVVYCLTGPMSEIASNDLIDRGYCNVFDMPAGMGVWNQLGYPMAE